MRKTSNERFKEYQAREAIRPRNEKLSALDNYTIALKAIAEIALEKQPQQCWSHCPVCPHWSIAFP